MKKLLLAATSRPVLLTIIGYFLYREIKWRTSSAEVGTPWMLEGNLEYRLSEAEFVLDDAAAAARNAEFARALKTYGASVHFDERAMNGSQDDQFDFAADILEHPEEWPATTVTYAQAVRDYIGSIREHTG